MIENFNRYSKYKAEGYLQKFRTDKWFTKMSNALLVYNVVLKQNTITLAICDKFLEGTYLPDTRKIIICSNTLRNERDFFNAA